MNRKQNSAVDRPDKVRSQIVVSLIVGVAVLLGLAQIIVANRLATQGELLREHQIEVTKITGENQRLENEIVRVSSLSYIASQSARLGLMRTSNIVYLPEPLPIAMERR